MAATPSKTITIQKTRSATTGVTGAVHNVSSPQTPLSRTVSASLYNSPSARFRVDDENLLIFEVGARVLRAGFAAESKPRCEISYSPEQLRRLGDYRQYAPNYKPQVRRSVDRPEEWARDGYELWQPDLRELDLSFIGERIERLIREVEITYLMLDTRPKKVSLVVSPQLPKLLLELTISALFNVLQGPSVTILASNVMSVISSGLRSALVVDIGWSETTISAVFEFREVSCSKTIKAAKELTMRCASILGDAEEMSLEEAEDLLIRLAWCRTHDDGIAQEPGNPERAIMFEWHGRTFHIDRDRFAHLVENTFCASDSSEHTLDDHDIPIHRLAYKVLLQLPIDVRKICMSRIVVVGGASNIPGLKTRLIQEIEHLISNRGWNPVKSYGSVKNKRHQKPDVLPETTTPFFRTTRQEDGKISETTDDPPQDPPPRTPAHMQAQEKDDFIEKILARGGANPSEVQGVLRGIHSLGPWAGASLLTGLRVRGLIEIEREKFMSSGLSGALARTNTSGRVASGSGDRIGNIMPIWL